MGTANASDPLQQLGAAQRTAIADLDPGLSDPAARAVRGVVTITWPYNSVKGTFAFILAEPDYRLRRSRGQVRINLSGASAKAASESGLSSSDEVLVSLDGVEWVHEEVKKRQSLPGAGIDWQLNFSDKLRLQVTLAETGETKLVAADHLLPAEPQTRVETPPTEISHYVDPPTQTLEVPTPPSKVPIAKFRDGEYEATPFVKRARMSYGSLFEDGYDIFEEDGAVKGRGRKRTRFGRESGAWKYSSQSPSPEPGSPQSSTRSPPRPEMADEGCQTMELDFTMPSPVQQGASTAEAQNNLKLTQAEELVAQPRQGMVDHGIQDHFHSEWPIATSVSLQPFDPNGGLPGSGSEVPAIQSTDQFNGFQQGWHHGSVDVPSDSYPHTTEPMPPNKFGDEYGGGRFVGLSAVRSGSHTRSLSEPNDLALEPVEHCLDDSLPAGEGAYSAQVVPQTTAYPPLELENEERDTAAHLDYPPSCLADSKPFSQEAMGVEKSQFSPRTPAAADARSVWTTVNDRPPATTTPSSDRFGSTEGESVENAIAIDDSDSDDGPPPPTAAEDTVMEGRADDLDMYEEAEVEDEVDAEYSDDDEPEYEADEIGGDYDTRNYTAPDDDEDDSHDEDLRPHNLEPEFDDGRSWEGESEDEDEDAENIEHESGHETDADDAERQRQPHPAAPSAPQIIDLISSSEDEGEDDEAHPPQPSFRPVSEINPRTQPKASQIITGSEAVKQGSRSESEEENVEGEDYEGISDEEEGEEESEKDDASSVHTSARSEYESEASEDDNMEEVLEESHEAAAQISTDVDIAELLSGGSQRIFTALDGSHPTDHTTDFSVGQKGSSPPSEAESAISQDGDHRMTEAEAEQDEGETNAPQSAAEGLEILSRAVESESNANSKVIESEKSDGVVDTNLLGANESHLVGRKQAQEEQAEHDSQDAQDDEEPVDMVSTLPTDDAHSRPKAIDEDKRAEAIAPSSPPLTHSFISQPTGEGRTEIILHESVTITETQMPADQLPTPRDTQPIGGPTVSEPSTAASMEIDEPTAFIAEEPIGTIAREISSTTEQSMKQPESLVIVEEVITRIEERPLELVAPQRQQTPIQEHDDGEAVRPDNLLVSPSLSFQTQVDADDMMQASYTEASPKAAIEAESESGTHSDTDADVSGASVSFRSQMEVDEELQASILEYSQEFEDANANEVDGREIDDQFGNYDNENIVTHNEDENRTESETQMPSISRAPSPELGSRESERREIRQDIPMVEPTDTPGEALEVDPSVQLARAANASKRNARQSDTIRKVHEDDMKFAMVESSSPTTEDSSVQLARASLMKNSQTEEDSNSMAAAKLKLVRHLRDELPDCTSLKVLRQHLHKKLDVIAIAMMHPPDPQRAKGGPREFMMSFTITDHSIGPYSVVEVLLYRPHKETLPIVKAGDVVLLRNFTVVSLQHKGYGLRTNDESSWAIFDHEDQPAQIKGPPVEYGEKETTYVAHMRSWFNLLDEKARAKLERANQKIINAGKSK
ncbi:hypothetical protein F5Y05DRAFT_382610 [Hypoxylon sp. FL0543]|nr:hypothetical protein F5Y05DRAFT_382610 [Hypoxylon sp. FL0543]